MGDDDDRLFEEEMRDVRPLERDPEARLPERERPAPVVRRAPAEARPPAFDAESRGESVVVFHPSVPPAARKALRRGETRPERTLDLHGVRGAEAARRVEVFVAESRSLGARCVLIVTGRGLRSGPRGPVLPAEVVRTLTEGALAGAVLGIVSAPPALGGSGALLVLLRKP